MAVPAAVKIVPHDVAFRVDARCNGVNSAGGINRGEGADGRLRIQKARTKASRGDRN